MTEINGWKRTEDKAGLVGYHKSAIVEEWSLSKRRVWNPNSRLPEKKLYTDVVLIRKYYGDYVVEWYRLSYYPFQYVKLGNYQTTNKKEALGVAVKYKRDVRSRGV